MGCLSRSCCRVSSLVEYCLVLVFLVVSLIFSFSKRITPSCLGELMLSVGSPAIALISSSKTKRSFISTAAYSFSATSSILTPVNSMSASTGISGISIVSKSFTSPCSFRIGSSLLRSCSVTSASSAAYSAIFSSSTRSIVAWWMPLLTISSSISTGE